MIRTRHELQPKLGGSKRARLLIVLFVCGLALTGASASASAFTNFVGEGPTGAFTVKASSQVLLHMTEGTKEFTITCTTVEGVGYVAGHLGSSEGPATEPREKAAFAAEELQYKGCTMMGQNVTVTNTTCQLGLSVSGVIELQPRVAGGACAIKLTIPVLLCTMEILGSKNTTWRGTLGSYTNIKLTKPYESSQAWSSVQNALTLTVGPSCRQPAGDHPAHYAEGDRYNFTGVKFE